MERKIENSNKTNKNEKKFKINMKPKEDVKLQLLDFYNQKIKKSHIIILVIMVILYAIFFFTTFSDIRAGNYNLPEGTVVQGFLDNVQQSAFLDFIIILAGITPYFYLSIIGVAKSVAINSYLGVRYALGASFMPTLFIGGLIQIVAVALCVAVGLYYCRLTSKKNKYYHQSSFGFDDVKMQLYEIRKDEKKIEEMKKKKMEKAKKIEESNVKIPYLNFVLLFIVAFVVHIVGVLIAMI